MLISILEKRIGWATSRQAELVCASAISPRRPGSACRVGRGTSNRPLTSLEVVASWRGSCRASAMARWSLVGRGATDELELPFKEIVDQRTTHSEGREDRVVALAIAAAHKCGRVDVACFGWMWFGVKRRRAGTDPSRGELTPPRELARCISPCTHPSSPTLIHHVHQRYHPRRRSCKGKPSRQSRDRRRANLLPSGRVGHPFQTSLPPVAQAALLPRRKGKLASQRACLSGSGSFG